MDQDIFIGDIVIIIKLVTHTFLASSQHLTKTFANISWKKTKTLQVIHSNLKDETKFCIGNLADSWDIKLIISNASLRIIYTAFPS